MLFYLKGEREITALVTPDKGAVERDLANAVNSTEVQYDSAANKIPIYEKGLFVDILFRVSLCSFDSRKTALGREGDLYIPEETLVILFQRIELPFARKGDIGVPDHLGAGVLRPIGTVFFKGSIEMGKAFFHIGDPFFGEMYSNFLDYTTDSLFLTVFFGNYQKHLKFLHLSYIMSKVNSYNIIIRKDKNNEEDHLQGRIRYRKR